MEQSKPSGSLPPARSRTPILVLLGIVAVGALASLPWQMRQWQEARRLRQEASLHETRLHDLRTRRDEGEAVLARLRESPQDIGARLEAARLFISRGESARGSRLLQEIDHQANGDPTLSRDAALAGALSSLYERIGWQDRALNLAQRAFALEPDSLEALMRIAFLEAILGWQKACQEHVQEAIRRAPESPEPHLALALVYDQIGGLPAAEKELLKADSLRPQDWHILLLLARNRIGQKRFDEAVATLDRAQQLNPAEPSLLAARTDALLQKIDRAKSKSPADLQAVRDAAEKYIHLAPQSPEARFLVGKSRALDGDEAGALAMWEEVYRIQPDFGRLRTTLGLLLARKGQRERAAKIMDEDRQAQTASDLFHRSITTAGQRRDDPEAHRQFARVCQEQNRLPRAILEWQEVLRLKPGDGEATAGIAACKKKRGDLFP